MQRNRMAPKRILLIGGACDGLEEANLFARSNGEPLMKKIEIRKPVYKLRYSSDQDHNGNADIEILTYHLKKIEREGFVFWYYLNTEFIDKAHDCNEWIGDMIFYRLKNYYFNQGVL